MVILTHQYRATLETGLRLTGNFIVRTGELYGHLLGIRLETINLERSLGRHISSSAANEWEDNS